MQSVTASIMGALSSLARVLTLPLLRAIGGILLTLTIPVLRFAAGVCLIVAAVALASDMGTATTGGQRRVEPTAVVQHWQQFSPTTMDTTRAFLMKRTRPWVWDAVSAPLRLPTFAFFSAVGLLLGYLGRRRSRVNIFAN